MYLRPQTRERLTELELPHLYKNCARNSLKRPEITAKWDVAQFPYIEVRVPRCSNELHEILPSLVLHWYRVLHLVTIRVAR